MMKGWQSTALRLTDESLARNKRKEVRSPGMRRSCGLLLLCFVSGLRDYSCGSMITLTLFLPSMLSFTNLATLAGVIASTSFL